MADCRFCKLPNVQGEATDTRTILYNCNRCGRYGLTVKSHEGTSQIHDEKRPRLSRWIRESSNAGDVPIIIRKPSFHCKAYAHWGLQERANKFLIYVVKSTQAFGQHILYYDNYELEALTETHNRRELHFIAQYLAGREFLTFPNTSGDCNAHESPHFIGLGKAGI